jgi:pSer/pThr/pTyr-binding forkhead associated (FHA) protein
VTLTRSDSVHRSASDGLFSAHQWFKLTFESLSRRPRSTPQDVSESDLPQPPGALHSSSPAELVARIEAERAGVPFILYRDADSAQRIVLLENMASPVSVGRGVANHVRIDWDENVSWVHAEIIRVGEEWTLVDDGLSRNGSFVNGERIAGRRRLRHGDVLRFGATQVTYRGGPRHDHGTTAVASGILTAAQLSTSQRRVLVALARPFRGSSGFATPATNQQIADELFLSVDTVKSHLRALFEKFGVQDLPQNQKRAQLVEQAFLAGVVSERDLGGR